MPELPEVETIKRDLSRTIIGKTIAAVHIMRPLVVRQDVVEFRAQLQGAAVRNVLRKGKLLLLELSNGLTLAVHLKMTGQLVYLRSRATLGTPRVRFELSDGSVLEYRDQRMFGELKVVKDWRALPFVKNLGPEPDALSEAQFCRMLKGRRTKIKPLLLDQGFIAGVGNLYAAEALFAARIHPERPAGSLTVSEQKGLFRHLVSILKKAIRHKGSSLDQYVRVDGSKGGYVQFHQVYGRHGEQCLRCKGTVRRITIGGRGTYYCPKCQRVR